MKYLNTLLIVFLAATQTAKAENANSDEKESKVRISVTGELNNADAWRMDAGCHWFPVQYVGIGGSIGMWKQYNSDYAPEGLFWGIGEDYRNASNLFIQPSVIFLSPSIFKKADDEIDIRIFGELGAMVNVPYERVYVSIYPDEYKVPATYEKVSSNNGNYIFFDGKIGLSVRFDKVSITAGYAYSTLDVYAQRRKMKYDNQSFAPFYPKRKATQGAFLSLAVNL